MKLLDVHAEWNSFDYSPGNFLKHEFFLIRVNFTEYDFRSSIMPCWNDGRMVFVVKSGRAQVDQSDCRIFDDPVGL